jgi:hypothetical protein
MCLPAKPKIPGCGFENGDGFIQHDRKTFLNVRHRLLEIFADECDHPWIKQALADDSVHPSGIARLLDDGGNRALQDAWHRIYCTDEQFREWGQPFFRMNPHQAKQVCLARA